MVKRFDPRSMTATATDYFLQVKEFKMDPSTSQSIKIALTIAGSDCSGGAGIQADLKTFQALGVFGMSAITAVTVQNTQKVYAIQEIEPRMVHDQIMCLFEDMTIDAVKIGMVSSVGCINAIADALGKIRCPPVVLDPVMISKSGYALLKAEARQALVAKLFPLAEVVTPNIHEAEALVGQPIRNQDQMEAAARQILELGAAKVVVKGGHMSGAQATDILYDGRSFQQLSTPRTATTNTHGTGCTFSSAIAAYLAKGVDFFQAVHMAKIYISGAIAHALAIGKGHGPTHHFYDLYARSGILKESPRPLDNRPGVSTTDGWGEGREDRDDTSER
jgi:hydroxymethylpyrimidine/phosphomethylpyrimidine kinase